MWHDNKTIVINNLTKEMDEWLKNNLEEGRYLVQPHTIRVKYSENPYRCDGGFNPIIFGGPTHPMGDDFEYRGTEITFEGEEDAVLFKCTFPDAGRKSSSGFGWDVI